MSCTRITGPPCGPSSFRATGRRSLSGLSDAIDGGVRLVQLREAAVRWWARQPELDRRSVLFGRQGERHVDVSVVVVAALVSSDGKMKLMLGLGALMVGAPLAVMWWGEEEEEDALAGDTSHSRSGDATTTDTCDAGHALS